MKRRTVLSQTIAILAGAAAILAGFLLWKSTTDAAVPGCGAGSGCDAVLSSRWSRLGPVPVAAAALAIYLPMLVFATTAASYQPRRRILSWRALLLFSIIAAGAALWFIAIQLFVLRRFCIYCTATHLLALAASCLVFWHWWQTHPAEPARMPMVASLGSGLLLVIALIATQLLFQPKLYTITKGSDAPPPHPPSGDDPPIKPPPTTINTPSTTSAPIASKRISLFSGRAQIEMANWPLLGSPQARHIIAVLFDYTCEHCRREHPLLQQARQRYGGQIAIIAIPMPLEPSCNKAVVRLDPMHVNSCTYVRFAMTVWKADPSRFEQYHNRLMEGERPPPLDVARQWAEELVGKAPLANLNDPLLDGRIEEAVLLYRAVSVDNQGKSRPEIPKLILPEHVVHGEVRPLQQMFDVLESHLDVKPIQ